MKLYTSIGLAVFIYICMIKETFGRSGGKGVLKVRITEFDNPQSKDDLGYCCMDYRRGPQCRGHCRTFFRVCATHSSRPFIVSFNRNREKGRLQLENRNEAFINAERKSRMTRFEVDQLQSRLRRINPHIPCTLGFIETAVVANSSLDATVEGALDITFPFSMPWPVTFKLIIEAWHDVNWHNIGTTPDKKSISPEEREAKLIYRHVGRHSIEPEEKVRRYKYDLPRDGRLQYSLHISCARPFYGPKCSKSCEELQAYPNSNIDCTEDGEVVCKKGWTGDLCRVPVCDPACHSKNGYCIRPGECRCKPGWKGARCDLCKTSLGCKHGYCNSTVDQCRCEPGWTGPLCDKPLCWESCPPTRGFCDKPGECTCRRGWEGPTCSKCKVLPNCTNGYCTKPLECKCNPGWTGLLCQTPICADNCSKEHGSCTKPGECRCRIGWWGEKCNACFPYPGCKHGSCNEPWQCNCHEGWTGMLCDISTRNETASFCTRNSGICLNGGTCIDKESPKNYECICPPLFGGRNCDFLTEKLNNDKQMMSASTRKRNLHAIRNTSPNTQPPRTTLDDIISTTTSSPDDNEVTSEDNNSENSDLEITELKPKFITLSRVLKNSRINKFRNNKEIQLQNRQTNVQSQQNKPLNNNQNPSKLPFTFIERALKPLPISLPRRVSDIIPGETSSSNLKVKRPTPILILDNTPLYKNVNVKNTTDSKPENDTRTKNEEIEENEEDNFITPATGKSISKPSTTTTSTTEKVLEATEEYIIPDINLVNISPIIDGININPLSNLYLKNLESIGVLNQGGELVHKIGIPFEDVNPKINIQARQRSDLNHKIRGPIIINAGTTPKDEYIDVQKGQEDIIVSGSEPKQTYYEENSAGRVHIGDVTDVDIHAPHEEIYEAFIELKKLAHL